MYRVTCIIVCVLNILCSFWLITEYLSPLQSFVFDCLFYLSLFSGLGLGVYTIIKSKSILILLNKADCIGVQVYRSAEVEVFWRRPKYLDLYTFLLCNESMSNTQWNEYLDSYSHIPYCDTVVFRYGGPAFGTDIIPKKDKEDFMLNHEIKKDNKNKPQDILLRFVFIDNQTDKFQIHTYSLTHYHLLLI